MRFVKQSTTLPIPVAIEDDDEGVIRRHGPLLPESIRCVVCGPSNCGKTNLMLGLITSPNGLRFENLYIYSNSLYQPKYTRLADIMSDLPEIGYFPVSDVGDVLDPNEAKAHSVFIFDDVACDKQEQMKKYFSMGRHRGVDSFYLIQSYARLPKHLLRDNVNLLILFKQDDTNLRHVYQDHVGVDMSWLDFKEMCSVCWAENPYDCLIIDKDRFDLNGGRYRKNFDEFITDI